MVSECGREASIMRSPWPTVGLLRHGREFELNGIYITAKAALKFGSEAWVLKKREEQRLEAAQMKFLRHLLRITIG